MDEYIMKANESTVWEEIDGCAQQYRCALAVFMDIFSLTLKIILYRAIGSSGNGKDFVDGLNPIG